ncbi:hypothetical protein ABW20_dc0110074 [Dactylellina cionopaga]|nr:hypothetical protein ABW20_dc0110074 [Dactylellina cionopaga]
MAPVVDRGVRRSSTKTHKKNPVPSSKPRGRAYTLTNLDSPDALAPPAQATEAPANRASSRSPTKELNRRASQNSQRYTIFPKSEKRGSFDGSTTGNVANVNLPNLLIPGSGNASSSNSPRPGISRASSHNSLREDASGIPTFWTNGDSPKASPTRLRGESGFYGPSLELTILPSRLSSRKSAKLHLVFPESPIDGTMKSVSTTGSSILDTFKRGSGPLPIPDKSPLRSTSPGRSIRTASPPATRPSSSCPTESGALDAQSPESNVKMRRRNTGYRPDRRLSQSPPPTLPPLPVPRLSTAISDPQVLDAHDSTSSGSTTVESHSGNTNSLGAWSQIITGSNANRSSGRPHSFSTNTTLSTVGTKERPHTRFSFEPIRENRDSLTVIPLNRESTMTAVGARAIGKTAEEAVDSFFQAQNGIETARPSLEEIDTEPQLARYVSITSTSGSCRTTIDFKPGAESLHSRVLSKSTIRTMDMLEEDDDTCTDIEDVTATPGLSRSDSIMSTSGISSHRIRPRQLRNLTDSTDISDSSTYSPTLSMLNFYSSSAGARYSMTAGPPSNRTSLATRRNSHVPNISIPQPQLYIHPNTQLEILSSEETLEETIEDTLAAPAPRGGSLSSATSPVSFTTADSSNLSYSPPMDAEIGAPIPMNAAIPIPTPRIYSSSQEDLSPMHADMNMKRQASYLNFNSTKSYGDLSSLDIDGRPSMKSLTVYTNLGPNAGSRLSLYNSHNQMGRSVSAGTESTLDKSSFRDLDMEKSTSGLLEFSDEAGSVVASSDGGEFDLEIGARDRARSRSRAVGETASLKRKRSAFFKDGRGRSRERRLV